MIPEKLNLANIPTPVQKIKFGGKTFFIKRDDFTGVELSGNKIRKLEYLLFDALKKRAQYIFTCGGSQSNHARATALAAASFGFKTRLFLWGSEEKIPDGNLFLSKMVNAGVVYLNRKNYEMVNAVMQEEKEIYDRKGKKVYVIPEGGSTTLGILGYVNFVKELSSQIDLSGFDSILLAAGTGGTAAGILAGCAHYKKNLTVKVVNVLYQPEVLRKKILNLAEGCRLDYNLKGKINPDSVQILNGYSSEGYKNISADKVQLIRRFAAETGILLDPVYTGKAFSAFHDLLKSEGLSKTIFLHTGGVFGVFAKRKSYLQAIP
ncbi:MAG: aminocyclopropane-1-carboxylate deaminase/D-cysteine desulfhydrase family protein [Ignavibacteriaceae bacterium]